MSARDAQLKRLCSGETLQRARSLCKQVEILCAPGTGYAIPPEGHPGLPAICAMIASEELNNTDVKERDARVNACIALKIFNKTLDTVRKALEAHYRILEREERVLFYEKIIKDHKLPHVPFLTSQMERVVQKLSESGNLRVKHSGNIDVGEEIVSVAIFFWTCTKCRIVKKRNITAGSLAREYGAVARDITEILSLIEKVCTDLSEDIWNAVLQMKATATPTASPTKPIVSKPAMTPSTRTSATTTPSSSRPPSPTKPALRSAVYGTPQGDAATPGHKRGVAFLDFDAESDADKTPTKPWKRRRIEIEDKDSEARFHEALRTPRSQPRVARHSEDETTTPRGHVSQEMSSMHTHIDGASDREVGDMQLGLHPDYATSEAEVETYVEMTGPPNHTGDSGARGNGEAEAEAEAEADEQTIQVASETPRHSQRIVTLPLTSTNQRMPTTPTKTRTEHIAKARAQSPVKHAPKVTPKRASTAPKRTPTGGRAKLDVAELPIPEDEDEVEPPLPRRCRPVLLSHRQWLQRDRRLEKQLEAAQIWKEDMIEHHGYPIALRTLTSLAIT